MRILNAILALTMFVQANLSYATPVTKTEVETTFKKLRYQLESGNFETTEELQKEASNITADLLAGGADAKQVLDFVRSNIKDAQKKSDFDALLKAIKIQKLSEKEMVAKVSSFFASLGQEGASYRRRTVIIHTSWPLALLIVTVIVLSATTTTRSCNYRTCYYY